MDSFQLKGNNGCISISLIKVYGFPDETSHFGGYEVNASIEIKSSNYHVKGILSTTTGEIYEFYQELKTCHNTVKGTAYYRSYENNLVMQVAYNPQGHTSITGEFREHIWEDNELKFEITGDQSYFQHSLSELQRLVSKYGDNKGIRQNNS